MATTSLPLRCRCGQVQGRLDPQGIAGRARCYCRYCQAYARFLGHAAETLDAQGGTQILLGRADAVRIEEGAEHLAAVRLSRQGPLRWYAACCRTAIGNTAPTPGLPFVGLVRDSLPASAAELDAAFGPARMAVNTAAAVGEPKPRRHPLALLVGTLGLGRRLAQARLGGGYRDSPFFTQAGAPVAPPRALSTTERTSLGL